MPTWWSCRSRSTRETWPGACGPATACRCWPPTPRAPAGAWAGVLLPAAEGVQALQDSAGLTASGQERGVQLRMPTARAPIVAAAIATARIFVVKAPGPVAEEPSSASPPGGTRQPPTDPSDPDLSEPGTSTPDLAEPEASA